MTQPPQQQPQNPPAQQPATAQPQKRAATPEVFGDGSTKKQQDQLKKENEEANRQVKELADAEREARST